MVALLVSRGLDVRGTPGGEALRAAVIARRHAAVRALLDAGAPVNHVSVNSDRTTPLAEAIQTRDLALIEMVEAAGGLEWVVE
jgi:ankyrin repeat protein